MSVSVELSGIARDTVARILEQVAAEGMDHPRNLDAALDAIRTAIQGEPVMEVEVDGVVSYIRGHDYGGIAVKFGQGTQIRKGVFVGEVE